MWAEKRPYCGSKRLSFRVATINFRIYDKREEKTKNDYFREMVKEVQAWGIKLAWGTGDSWYSSLENLNVPCQLLVDYKLCELKV